MLWEETDHVGYKWKITARDDKENNGPHKQLGV
jgi:hypothetical protein